MRLAIAIFLFAALLVAPAAAQVTSAPPAPSQACGSATGALTNAGDSVQLVCPGSASYLIALTPNGGTGLTGTITSTDTVTGGGRLLFKTGVGELDTVSVPMFGGTGSTEYRTIGGNGQKITLSCPSGCSGSASVTIMGSNSTMAVFPNSAFHTSEEAALRAGRAYTAGSSVQSVPATQNLSFLLTNPASNNLRLVVTQRVLACDLASGNTAPKYYSLSSPTANLPTTAATITNRRTGGVASVTSAAYGVGTTRPDTSPTTAAPIGGILPTAGIPFEVPGMRTVEPGTSFALWIGGTTTGLAAASNCSINVTWYEETVN